MNRPYRCAWLVPALLALTTPALQSAEPASLVTNATRELRVEKRYLNLPVKTGAPKRRLAVLLDGRAVREFEIELAEGTPDFWAFLELTPFNGKQIVLRIDRLAEGSKGFQAIQQADAFLGSENLYREPLRPQFHFSSRRGWNNDPNGLVYYKGEYHLYYQHNPYGWDWGNMHWGHAVSKDLVHWTELPTALYPRQFGDWAFSGSAVVDEKNTSGFKTGKESVLVAAYTSTGRGECILFSNDRGRTWEEYSGNPVVRHQGRDPRVLWHEESGAWVMALYDEAEGKQWITFHTSPDLKTWTYRSRIAGFFECPDLFELPVNGDPKRKKWVLTAASSEYMVGNFDGQTFTPETPKLPGHRGNGFYAAQTFTGIPRKDGRVIQIGWGQMPSPGMSFNQMMCLPCELGLRDTPDGPRLTWAPIKEVEKLRGRRHHIANQPLTSTGNPLEGFEAELLELAVELEQRDAQQVRFDLHGLPVILDFAKKELSCPGKTQPFPLQNGTVKLRIFLDRTSLEIFSDDGLFYMPIKAIADRQNRRLEVKATGGPARIRSLDVWSLKSIWK